MTGPIAETTEDIDALGFGPGVTHLFTLKLVINNIGEGFSVQVKGNKVGPVLDKNTDLDGSNFMYMILDGNTSSYTITVKASTDTEPVDLVITNEATLENA